MIEGLKRSVRLLTSLVMDDGRLVHVAVAPDPWQAVMSVPFTKKLPLGVMIADFGGDWAKVTVWLLPVEAWAVW